MTYSSGSPAAAAGQGPTAFSKGLAPSSSSTIQPMGVTPVSSLTGTKKADEKTTLLLVVPGAINNSTTGEEKAEGIDAGFFGKGARRSDNSRLVTTLLLLNYMIGSGILNAPQTFRDSGIAATTVLYLLSCAATWVGAVVLISAAEACSLGRGNGSSGTFDDLEFGTLAARTLGKYGPPMVEISIIVGNFGAVCSYVLLVGGLTTSLLAEWSEAAGRVVMWWESFYLVTPLIVLMLVLPPCLVRHLSNLRWLCVLSLTAIAAVVGLVWLGSPSYAEAERLEVGELTALDAPLLWWNWTGTFRKMGSVVFATSCAAAALHSYSAMGERTVSEWKKVSTQSVVAGGTLCYGTGLMGYLSFRGATEGDILENFSGPVAACFKVLVVVHLVFYIPNEVIVLRHSLFTLASSDVMAAGFFLVASVTFGVLALIVAVVTALMLAGVAEGDLFGYILDVSGGVSTTLISFVLPPLAYLQVTKGFLKQDFNARNIASYRLAAKILSVFGFVVMVMVPVAVIISALEKMAE